MYVSCANSKRTDLELAIYLHLTEISLIAGGHMSNDNLILFPKKSTSNISMSESEAKWMVAGSLLVVLTLALGVNSALFSQNQAATPQTIAGGYSAPGSRAPASINPIMKVSWEKRAFEILAESKSRDLANVGKKPSLFDSFALGTLEGHYSVRKVDGLIKDIQFSHLESSSPKSLLEREGFLKSNLALFSKEAKSVKQIQTLNNGERHIEKFKMVGANGQDLGVVQVLLDKNQNLLSMTVQ